MVFLLGGRVPSQKGGEGVGYYQNQGKGGEGGSEIVAASTTREGCGGLAGAVNSPADGSGEDRREEIEGWGLVVG